MWNNQPQGNQPPYPPQPGAPAYPPSPYYQQQGQPPYPSYPAPGQPYGGAPGYPQPQAPGFAVGGPSPGYPAPSPGYPGSTPYPHTGAPAYPPAATGSPYPNITPGVPAYPAPGSSPYPNSGSAPTYPPTAPGTSPYPAYGQPPGGAGSPYPTQATGQSPGGFPPQYQQTYNPTSSSPYPTQQVTTSYPSEGSPAHQPITASTTSHNYSAPTSKLTTMAMQQYQEIPTIKDGHFDATSDAQILRKAMKGFGTDEAAIINVLAKRTNAQRQQISQAFKTGFGKDLIKDLKSELGGKLEDVVLALMTPKYDYIAQVLHKAMSGIGTKEKTLVDILCTATNSDIQWLNSTYHRLFKRTIEKDIKGDTSGHFERLLVSMTTGARNEDSVADPSMATEDAQKLLQAGEKKWGTDESTFNLILATRSFAQLRLMFHEYERITGHSFDKAIDSEFSGDVRSGMLAIVKSARNRAAYFAERLHQSIAGLGTKDNDLIFILVTRAEIDLENIKQEYQRMYGKALASDVAGDTSGDYKKILLALLGN